MNPFHENICPASIIINVEDCILTQYLKSVIEAYKPKRILLYYTLCTNWAGKKSSNGRNYKCSLQLYVDSLIHLLVIMVSPCPGMARGTVTHMEISRHHQEKRGSSHRTCN